MGVQKIILVPRDRSVAVEGISDTRVLHGCEEVNLNINLLYAWNDGPSSRSCYDARDVDSLLVIPMPLGNLNK